VTPVEREADRAIAHQGRYAGPVTRLVAYLVDLGIISALFTAALALVTAGINTVTPWTVDFSNDSWLVGALYVVWWAVYFANGWLLRSKSPGMALLGLRIVRGDGSDLDARHAMIRLVAFPLGFLTLGLGFLGIIVSPHRKAIYDRIADTAVIYAWDAESARIREIARARHEVAAAEATQAADVTDVPVQSPG
jgi:uncharacterized RDD family membrane protein YckC